MNQFSRDSLSSLSSRRQPTDLILLRLRPLASLPTYSLVRCRGSNRWRLAREELKDRDVSSASGATVRSTFLLRRWLEVKAQALLCLVVVSAARVAVSVFFSSLEFAPLWCRRGSCGCGSLMYPPSLVDFKGRLWLLEAWVSPSSRSYAALVPSFPGVKRPLSTRLVLLCFFGFSLSVDTGSGFHTWILVFGSGDHKCGDGSRESH
ncbi:hypothetical protein Bca101_009589 [Brassica carinata]